MGKKHALAALLWVNCCGCSVAEVVSLLQSLMEVSNTSDQIVRGRFLVDNSELKHAGPGILLRKSENLDDIAGLDQFVSWGTIFDGQTVGDGWVKYDNYFLPTTLRGARVMTLKNVVVDGDGPVGQHAPRPLLRFLYAPTRVTLSNGSLADCRILHTGSKPETYNIEVFPPHFSSYNMTDVPVAQLEKVSRIRNQDHLQSSQPTDPPVEASMHIIVKEKDGHAMDLKMLKKSPARTFMKMACDKSGIKWIHCQKRVKFRWKGDALSPDARPSDLGMSDGATIVMVIPPLSTG